ncbi:MAG: O-antigen ligase family protein [Planctomycetia bacterium]|nr:O-antigen ligase family protein [Planctomycetia bacterium]
MIPFVLFLLVTAVLIIRPAEIIPGLENAQIYEFVILGALAASANAILRHLSQVAAGKRPVSVCMFGLLGAVALSHLTSGTVGAAATSGFMFLKIVLFYLLLVANLRTTWRIRVFLLWLCVLMMAQVGLGLLQYFEVIDVEALKPHLQSEYDPTTSELIAPTARLCGAGIFHDPNDLCVLLAVGVVFTLYKLTDRSAGAARFAWMIPLGVFLGAIPLTHSRGGLLALLAGLGTLAIVRLGARRGMLLLALAIPVLFVAVGGRMTHFDVNDANDTSQHRLRAWSDGLLAFRQAPVFGVGQGKYEDHAGLVAHNTYVESYTELGFFGGTCFVAAFAYVTWCLLRLRRSPLRDRHPELARLRPYMLAALVALMVGLVSLSRGYTPPTYLFLGLAASYLHLAASYTPRAVPPLTTELVLRGVGLSGLILAALQIFTVTFVRWS